jgi:hypothetical protein
LGGKYNKKKIILNIKKDKEDRERIKNRLKLNSSVGDPDHFDTDSDPVFNLIQIRIRLFSL